MFYAAKVEVIVETVTNNSYQLLLTANNYEYLQLFAEVYVVFFT